MSQENVEVVLSAYRRAQAGDAEGLELLAEDVVWDMSGFGLPDLARVYHGREGVGRFWASWLAAWERIEFTRLAPEDHGERVIVEVEQRNLGRGSGVPVDFHYFQSFTVRDGKITASRMGETRADVL